MVSDSMEKDGWFESKVDQCGVFCLRVMANSVLCVQWGMWIIVVVQE